MGGWTLGQVNERRDLRTGGCTAVRIDLDRLFDGLLNR